MVQTEAADIGVFMEESTAIAGLVIKDRKQLKEQWLPFLEMF